MAIEINTNQTINKRTVRGMAVLSTSLSTCQLHLLEDKDMGEITTDFPTKVIELTLTDIVHLFTFYKLALEKLGCGIITELNDQTRYHCVVNQDTSGYKRYCKLKKD